jgi:tRNA threonylcarbamoyladenosine biosynthesis protein TsaE
MNKQFITKNEQETMDVGREFAREIADKNVTVALIGDLGAGKTTFMKGVAAELGVKSTIKSPTFVVLKEYESKFGKLVHVDAYRLADNFEDIGLVDYFGRAKVFVEWAGNIEGVMPKDTVYINFRYVEGGREIVVDQS